MLTIRKIDAASPDWPEFRRLYRSAFPIQERICLDVYLEDHTGTLDILGFYDDADAFCGLAIMMSYDDLTQILFFAIEEELRGKGYGSAAIQAMLAYYPSQRIMADVEEPSETSLNNGERLSRLRFYQKNGFLKTPVRLGWEGERYEMLISRGALTDAEYSGFWRRAAEDRGKGFEVMEYDKYSIGLKRGTVRLAEHVPEWDIMAEDTVRTIKKMLPGIAVDVQHVGSTAIPSIKAKPILDIAVGIRDPQEVLDKTAELAACQFILRKVEWPRELLFSAGDIGNDFITHHIHIVEYGTAEWNNYLNLRDYLNTHAEAAREYEALKTGLCEEYKDDRSSYTQGKAGRIAELLEAAAEWRNS